MSRADRAAAHPSGLRVVTADLAAAQPIRWAWERRLPLGTLSLVVGEEEIGKGTLAAWFLARLTCGELPGDLEGEPTTVAIIGDEDSFEDVWTPRLHAAGANLTRVRRFDGADGGLVELRADRQRLDLALDLEDVKVVYLDALVDNLGADVNDWSNKHVRQALAPIKPLARKLEVAFVGSLHPNKSGVSFRQLVNGSIGFNAVSRSSLLLARHPTNNQRRVLVRGKGNLSATPQAVEFNIEGHSFDADGRTFDVPRAVDFTVTNLTIADLLQEKATRPLAGKARTTARELLTRLLANGEWHDAGAVTRACIEDGVDHTRAVRRAAEDLGVERDKRGFPARSYWRLTSADTSRTPAAPVQSVRSVHTKDHQQVSTKDRADSVDSVSTRPPPVRTGGELSTRGRPDPHPLGAPSGKESNDGALAETDRVRAQREDEIVEAFRIAFDATEVPHTDTPPNATVLTAVTA